MFMKREMFVLVSLLFAFAFLVKLLIIFSTDGGFDISLADLPKTVMFIEGSNPYSVSSWAAPYPPFYFVVFSGILLVSSGFNLARPVAELIFALRFIALLFDVATGFVIYITLIHKKIGNFKALAILAFYFCISTECQFWFHGDAFGYFFIALAAFFFVSERYSLGSLFLGLSVIFKIHPFLSLFPVVIWFYRKRVGFSRNVIILCLTVFLGLFLPVMFIPHSFEVLVGYNSSTRPLYTCSLFNFFYNVLPIFYQQNVPLSLINTVWIIATFGMLFLVSFIVWRSYERIELIDALILGLVAWILPLRQVLNYYLIWFMIPFLMKGNLLENFSITSLQGMAVFVATFGWADFKGWNIPPSPNAALIFFAVAVLYTICGFLIMFFILFREKQGHPTF